MRLFWSRRALAAMALVGITGTHLTAAQSNPAPQPQTAGASLDARLNAIGLELFTKPGTAKDVIRQVQAILAETPESANAHVLLGLAYTTLGAPEMMPEAVAEFRQALAIEPRLVTARFYLARVYMDVSQPERAREELTTALEQAPNRPELLAALSETERTLGNASRAVELARQALGADPKSAQARYALGLALIDAGQAADAIAELAPLISGNAPSAAALYALGGVYLDQGRAADAITALTRAMTLAPPRPQSRVQLARALRLHGDLQLAASQLDQVFSPGMSIQASADYQRLETDLALEQGLLAMAQGQVAAAVAAYTRAVTMDPARGAAHQHLAEAYLAVHRFAEASAAAARARELGSPLNDADTKQIADGLAGRPVTKP